MTEQQKQKGLWRNCEDSIRHALEHFSAAASEDDRFHHQKWALLSVAHAAEAYGNLLLCVFNPEHPATGRYPALNDMCNALKNHQRLSPSEHRVFEDILPPLGDQRNTLMHKPAPEELDVTDAAIALLSLLHIVRRRKGLATKEFFDQDPPVEQDVFDLIGWRDHERWRRTAEFLVASEFGDDYVRGCDYCGAFAVPPGACCQACFHEAHH